MFFLLTARRFRGDILPSVDFSMFTPPIRARRFFSDDALHTSTPELGFGEAYIHRKYTIILQNGFNIYFYEMDQNDFSQLKWQRAIYVYT